MVHVYASTYTPSLWTGHLGRLLLTIFVLFVASHLFLDLLPDVRNRTQASHMSNYWVTMLDSLNIGWHFKLQYLFSIFKIKKIMIVCACMYVCTYITSMRWPRSREEGVRPRDWSYRWFWTVMWGLGAKLESSARATDSEMLSHRSN